eukprot:gene29982-37126_t
MHDPMQPINHRLQGKLLQKSPARKLLLISQLVTVSKVKRNCVRATERGKEAWSVNREPMNKNRIEGVAKQGEQAHYCKALVTKARWRKCGGCAMKPEREVSRGRSSGSTRPTRPDGDREGPNESESLRTCKAARPCVRCWGDLGGDEAGGTLHEHPDTGMDGFKDGHRWLTEDLPMNLKLSNRPFSS